MVTSIEQITIIIIEIQRMHNKQVIKVDAQQHHPRQDGAVVFCSFRYTTERLLYFADHTAGNLFSGIAGRLGAEVIGITVYDHSPSDNIRNRKPVRSYGQIRIPLTRQ